jgi:hypothetical protein
MYPLIKEVPMRKSLALKALTFVALYLWRKRSKARTAK